MVAEESSGILAVVDQTFVPCRTVVHLVERNRCAGPSLSANGPSAHLSVVDSRVRFGSGPLPTCTRSRIRYFQIQSTCYETSCRRKRHLYRSGISIDVRTILLYQFGVVKLLMLHSLDQYGTMPLPRCVLSPFFFCTWVFLLPIPVSYCTIFNAHRNYTSDPATPPHSS
jgi:hypothetical protein